MFFDLPPGDLAWFFEDDSDESSLTVTSDRTDYKVGMIRDIVFDDNTKARIRINKIIVDSDDGKDRMLDIWFTKL